ncbi:hypothetical protein Tco_0032361 [Tanacetum coccineum]
MRRVCRTVIWCNCKWCGNDLRDGYCFLCHSRNGDSFTYDSTPNSFDNPPDFSYPTLQPQYVPYSCELCGTMPIMNRPAFYNNDDDDEEYTNKITPVLPTVEPDNSLSMRDEHLSTIPENLEVVEIVIPEVGGIDIDILLTIKDDILREKLLNFNLLIAKIEALKDNPTPSSDFVTNSGSTTTRSDYSLPNYEAFYCDDDHIEEKSSGSTTTHSNFSLSKYDSFIFDLSIDPFPPDDRSDFYHEEFADELAHIISPPEYDCFYFKIKPELGDFTMDVVEDIFDNLTREPRIHVPNVLPTHPTLHMDSDFTLSSDSLGSDLVVSFPSRTRNKIFDPGIVIEVQSKRFLSPNEFSISFIRDPLSPVFDTLLPFSSKNEDKVFNPSRLSSNEEKSPHLLSHRGFNPSKIISDFSESPMMIYGGDIPILDVSFLHFYPP